MILKDRMKRHDPIWRRLVKRAFGSENKGFVKAIGAAGGAAGDISVTGILQGDHLVCVYNVTDTADLTSEFSITADGTVNNTGGTATTGDSLLVIWEAFDGE